MKWTNFESISSFLETYCGVRTTDGRSVGNTNHWFFDFDYGQSLYKDNFITYVTAIIVY